jgi:hypothetical protein
VVGNDDRSGSKTDEGTTATMIATGTTGAASTPHRYFDEIII